MALDIERLRVGQMETNCYLVCDKDSRETVIIDPGDDASYIIEIVEKNKHVPVAVCVTHGHFDHVLAVWELIHTYDMPFYLHPHDAFLLSRMRTTASKYLGRAIVEPTPEPTDNLHEGKKIFFGNQFLTTKELPGHTPGSVGFISSDKKACLCGDTLFAEGGIGDWHHTYSDKKDLDASVAFLLALPSTMRLYPGHGDTTTVEQERPLHIHFKAKP